MEACQVCGERAADRVLGVTKELSQPLELTKSEVFDACGECADKLICRGVAREIHPSTGEANDIWYSDRYEITDGEESLSVGEQIPVRQNT